MSATTEIQKMPQQTGVASFNFFDPVQFETMQRVCKMFASSELVPDMYKATVKPFYANTSEADVKAIMAENKSAENKAMANCMIAIEMAQRIGASPLMIMQNMVIIYGRPSWSSKFLIATVNTCGRFEPLKYKIVNLGKVGKVTYTDYVWNGKSKAPVQKEYDGTQIDNLQCIAYTCANGSNEVLESSPIDIRMAIKEGWYTKSGSKWVTMTRQMLMYRAASFWTNAYAPELSMGMKTEDEIRDIIDVEYEDVTDRVERTKTEKANKETINIDNAPKDSDKKVDPAPVKGDSPKEEAPKAEPGNVPGPEGTLFNDGQQVAPKRPKF